MNLRPDTHRQECAEAPEGMIVIQDPGEIPPFTSEEEEVAFWDTHRLAPHLFQRRGITPGSVLARIAEERAQKAQRKQV